MGNGQGLKSDIRNRIILMGTTTSWLWGDERPWGPYLGLTKRETATKKLHNLLFNLNIFHKWEKMTLIIWSSNLDKDLSELIGLATTIRKYNLAFNRRLNENI